MFLYSKILKKLQNLIPCEETGRECQNTSVFLSTTPRLLELGTNWARPEVVIYHKTSHVDP